MQAIIEYLREDGHSPETAIKAVLDYLKARLPESTQSQLDLAIQDMNIRELMDIWFTAIRPPYNLDHDLATIQQLLDMGLDVNLTNAKNETALHLATWWDRTAIVEFLLDHGASVNHQDMQGRDVIDIALATNANLQLVKLLHQHGATLDILSASLLGKLDIVKTILRENLKLVHTQDWFSQEYPLHKAARGGNLKTVHLLLKAGSPVRTCNLLGTTALHIAAQFGHISVVELLLEHKAKINAKDKQGATPLDYAIHNGGGQPDTVNFLRSYGGKQYIEKRSIQWHDFIDQLEDYYERQDCAIEIRMADDGSGLETFNIQPYNKSYFIQKVRGGQEAFSQEEALSEIKHVFFPNEPVIIRDICQWQAFSDESVDLLVELPEGN